MKHLRNFNEDINIGDIKSKIENNIAYLLDLGYKVEIDNNKNEIDIKSIVNPNEELVCIYCMDELTETFALVPCGHTNLCTKCYTDQNLKHCPICRKDINMRIKIYK